MYVVYDPTIKLSKKALQIIEICKSGGFVRYALERNVFGREQFETRVYMADGTVVKGLGYKSAYQCIAKGVLKSRDCIKSTAYAQEWSV